MGTFIVTDVIFPEDAGPILQIDPAIDGGTMFVYDIMDPVSWPSQGAASISDTIIDLSGTANATVAGASMSWGPGLEISAGSSGRIVLPTTSDLASDVSKFAITVWVTFTDIADVTDSVLTMGKSGSGYDNTQYIIFTSEGTLRWNAGGGSIARNVGSISEDVVHQIGITIELAGGTYTHRLWLNGEQIDSFTTSAPMVDALAEAAARIGQSDIFGATPGMIFWRCNANDLSEWSAEEFIEADYFARSGQFG